MNILIIATYFPPDSTIAAVRPYMFAKYLSAKGEKVTVLRTGEFDLNPYDEYEKERSFEVLSALGKNCPAERFERGEPGDFSPSPVSRGQKLPYRVRLPLKAVRDAAEIIAGKPPKCIRHKGEVLKCQKKVIDRLYASGRRYDVVFATCGSFENNYAGRYAARKFQAKWIMDFRDNMLLKDDKFDNPWWNIYAKEATVCAAEDADMITAVSEGLKEDIRSITPTDKIRVLYNGFDSDEVIPEVTPDKDSFSFCYTGRLYDDQLPVLKDFAFALSRLLKKGILSREKVRFYYAGSSAEEFKGIFSKAGISDILTDCGYLSKTEALDLQLSSDLFTVISWNTRSSRGILTGKFYEGIKAGKPILTLVAGNEPDSELMQLQKRYNYGFCYELSGRKTGLPELEKYIAKLYKEKMSLGSISYKPSEELYNAFCYRSLTERLYGLMRELTP